MNQETCFEDSVFKITISQKSKVDGLTNQNTLHCVGIKGVLQNLHDCGLSSHLVKTHILNMDNWSEFKCQKTLKTYQNCTMSPFEYKAYGCKIEVQRIPQYQECKVYKVKVIRFRDWEGNPFSIELDEHQLSTKVGIKFTGDFGPTTIECLGKHVEEALSRLGGLLYMTVEERRVWFNIGSCA